MLIFHINNYKFLDSNNHMRITNSRESNLARMCEGIAINHKNSIFNEKNSYYVDDFPGYKLLLDNLEIYVSLVSKQTNYIDVIFNEMKVFSGLGSDAYADDDSVKINLYIKGLWELIVEDLDNNMQEYQ